MKERILAFKVAKVMEIKDVEKVTGSGVASRTVLATNINGEIDLQWD